MIDHPIVVGGVITRNRENLWAVKVNHSYSCILFYSITDFVCDSEVVQNICKGDCKVKSGMGARNFDNIKQETNWYAFVLQVYCDCH